MNSGFISNLIQFAVVELLNYFYNEHNIHVRDFIFNIALKLYFYIIIKFI